ncbi:MAG: response regulator, partial [Saprospiraceae bacterium]|nr:response regulator [Saprospiraceae bacterium]
MVVNDDATQLNMLCGLLHKAGVEPLAFKSAESALAAMHQDLTPDLIITDVYMPGIDGWRFCRLLRSREYERFNLTPILVLSATFSGEEPSNIASDLGAN